MRIITVVNQKGGVGKTTSVINVGAGIARKDRNVLLIDLDPQANLSEGCGTKTDELKISIYDVLLGESNIKDAIVTLAEGLDLVPASIDLCGAESELLQLPGKDLRLKMALSGINGYDYVLIDCPPSLGQLTLNALSAAKEIFIPVQCEYYSLKGIKKLLNTVELVKKWSNRELEITGVIATRYDARRNLNREVIEQLRNHFREKLFSTLIRENISLAEAPTIGKTIFDYKLGCKGSEDYMALCAEIIEMEDRP